MIDIDTGYVMIFRYYEDYNYLNILIYWFILLKITRFPILDSFYLGFGQFMFLGLKSYYNNARKVSITIIHDSWYYISWYAMLCYKY